jgi:hypothetical protein
MRRNKVIKEDAKDKKKMEKRLRHPRKRLNAAVFQEFIKKRGYDIFHQRVRGSNPGDELDDLMETDSNEEQTADY